MERAGDLPALTPKHASKSRPLSYAHHDEPNLPGLLQAVLSLADAAALTTGTLPRTGEIRPGRKCRGIGSPEARVQRSEEVHPDAKSGEKRKPGVWIQPARA